MRRRPGALARLCLLAVAAAAPLATAQELLLLGGATREARLGQSTHGWAVEYAQDLGPHAFATLAWLNEGHVDDHHRDGHAAQAWLSTTLFDPRLTLAAGIGPYRYFDTEQAARGASYANDHGWGAISSVGLAWYGGGRWRFHLRANRIEAHDGIDTTMVLLGAGYRLDGPDEPGPGGTAAPAANELAVLGGRTILNSFASETSAAFAAEYRRRLGAFVDWTAGWLHEGGNGIIRRNGLTTQLWLVRDFPAASLTLGAGGGAYVALDRENRTAGGPGDDERTSGLVTLGASYRIDPHWSARFSWNRVVTRYDRDTDVILLGAGYRF